MEFILVETCIARANLLVSSKLLKTNPIKRSLFIYAFGILDVDIFILG